MPSTIKEKIVAEVEKDFRVYVVTANAISIRTGKLKTDVRRFKRKARLRLDANSAQTRMLVASKCIMDETSKLKASTALSVTRAMGADDDPAHAPKQEFLPLEPSKNAPIDL